MKKMLPGVGVFGNTAAMRCYIPMLKSCGLDVVALWARTVDEAKELADELGIEMYTTDVDKVLLHKDVDLVVISCSPHLQAHIAAKALGIGKHVLCSPPSGPRSRDTLPMVHASRYYPKLMALMFNGLRFLPSIVKMRGLIKDGYIGDITICEVKVHNGQRLRNTFDWMCDEMMGGGVLNMYGGMIVDILTHVTGQRATRVQGMLKTYTKQTEYVKGIREITSDDFCSFQMELDGGACATVTLNGHAPGQFIQEIIIVGTKGQLILRGSDLYGQKRERVKEELLNFDPVNYKDIESLGIHEKVRSEIPVPYMKGVIRMVESVRDAFQQVEERQGWSPDPVNSAATFEDCFYVQTVLDTVRAASKARQSIKVVLTDTEPEPNPFLSTAMRRSTFSLH
ncbi:glucose-fructose oxidoreductase domain-containing protein 1 [Biomphalaria glabrata]|uniref:Glucose-fructose oxidoreductase domain-containing protein 1-like n=2 Tax=Biomphalaria TaxID=6525 RepID=A0A2C9K2E3_BIOGL|nr:glucose-fructose oxidoreductase domain-containing protein 1-like [Biomphalaria glabrata]XP_013095170.1 glucose-fructose oxidoreductase domain-containing protein 1-like [Biomphalaria glabrata]XP_013095171.1 glucose-fructose oxidoreductase domain-containing protein 1-like [Biomphalaria glabrata]KAK0056825.1 glucose-fructose oxidoreductase domain-containing protein 1 [Biomphalaria pfeifferi]KAI8737710.1 glucose-fructose oxidoreductase domain-containing protein 1-like [Biomphalaria glabrata]KAI